MNYVRAGAIDGEREVKQGGFVVHNEPDGIWASWLATDHQSGIDTYMVAMGTSPGLAFNNCISIYELQQRKQEIWQIHIIIKSQ